jgi:hypothetical protein
MVEIELTNPVRRAYCDNPSGGYLKGLGIEESSTTPNTVNIYPIGRGGRHVRGGIRQIYLGDCVALCKLFLESQGYTVSSK